MTIIDEIKAKARIEDVISADGVKLKKSGASYTGFCPFHENKHTPSFVVYPNDGDNGIWKCFGDCNESGDVIDYVQKRNPGWDKSEAIRYLAEKYGIDLKPAKNDLTGRIAAATAADVRKVAMGVFRKWLVGEIGRRATHVADVRSGGEQKDSASQTPPSANAALAYALDRGWTVETLKFEGVGFSGNGTEAERKEMADEFRMYGIDPLCPTAVMITGFHGDVKAWAEKYDLDPDGFGEKYIMGFMDTPGLMYAHKFDGVIEYPSCRFLPEWEAKRERKSHNPPSALAGEKRAYRNSLYRHRHGAEEEKGALLYVVEGQGDAVTLRQFGFPAAALCGSSWKNLVESGEVADWLNDYEEIIYVTDADTAGEQVVTGKDHDFAIANALGAMLWVGRTPKKEWKRPDGTLHRLKDTNDIAQWMKDTGEKNWGAFNSISKDAERVVVLAARYAGTLGGHDKETTLDKIVKPMILSIPAEKRVLLDRDLAIALYPSLSKANATTAYNRWLRAQEKAQDAKDEDADKLPEAETFGGWYPTIENKDSGHLVETYYDRETGKLRLAWAHIKSLTGNVREIGWGKTLTLENKILVAPEYDATVQDGIEMNSSALKMPTKVGEKLSTAEIIKRFSHFYQKYFFSEDKSKFKFCAVWALNTHVYDCFDTINILRAMGPAGSGKSDLMYLVGLTSYRFAVTAATSSPTSHVGLAKLYHSTESDR